MNEFAFYSAIGVGLLLVSLVIPGLKVIAEAILKLLMEFFVVVLKNKGTFVVWLIKTLSSDHKRILQHATQARNDIDPTQKVRRQAEGYPD